jgi:hypothetical protein
VSSRYSCQEDLEVTSVIDKDTKEEVNLSPTNQFKVHHLCMDNVPALQQEYAEHLFEMTHPR